ncbi:biosynthetic-type acetolactate synthase large subunit [Peptoniphilus sp.]|uniref:biosynthetic-type acetolactate synthase large subunit n=1 Tax=Peptoniphilus sp. TaxID=1971214 RepID=UPI002A82908F|nr:biosynthetic-type acetolactate synthase large subunit [Peptoniphilus sp.]MDY3902291.1 biosynthetic-type acetolactate synthase large subunit [Peptoniphilus sp.]
MKYSGNEIILKTLTNLGIDTIFGYPGGAVIDLYDAIYDYKDIINIRTSHEQSAAHSADGYARSSGKTGVCLATSGPGATNLVTGIATAFMDSVPMIAITGNVSTSLLGRDSFQEIDIVGMTIPITKHSFLIKDIEDLEYSIVRAYEIANDKRKGPVLIDIPKDILSSKTEFKNLKAKKEEHGIIPNRDDLLRISNLINNAKKPVAYVGGGVKSSGAYLELRKLLKKGKIPSCHTITGKGVLDPNDDLDLGLVGMHGNQSANYAIEECDLLVAIGVRFSDRVALNRDKFAPNATIIQIDIDESEIDKNVFVDINIVCDIKDIVSELEPLILEKDRCSWQNRIAELKEKDRELMNKEEGIKPFDVIDIINEDMDENTIIVTDVGQHQMWAAQRAKIYNPRNFITSAGLGTMGFGMGASIGAKCANKDKEVILITGDGSFHMNLIELATSVYYGMKIIVIVLNNNALGMIKQWQHLIYHDRFSQTKGRNTKFDIVAKGFGAMGYDVNSIEEFRDAFNKARASKITSVINVNISDKNLVLPMIPAGGTVDDLIVE